jgi:hypothetical protein
MREENSLYAEYTAFWNGLDNFHLITDSVKWRYGNRVPEHDWLDETRSFADLIVTLMEQRNLGGKAAILGAGSGSLISHLARLGFSVDAFDVSRFRLDEARRYTSAGVRYHEEEGLQAHAAAALEAFDLTVSVGYLHNLVSADHLKSCLQHLAAMTRTGGGFLYQIRIATGNPRFSGPPSGSGRYDENFVRLATANFYWVLDRLQDSRLCVTDVKFAKNDMALFVGYKSESVAGV